MNSTVPEFTERSCSICGSDNHRLLLQDGPTAYRECLHCGAIFASPLPSRYEEVNEAAYNQALEKYTAKIDARLAINMRTLRRFARFRQAGTFLEIGCNAGATLVAAEKLGWKATGVDISRTASTWAREKRGLNAITGTVEQAAFATGTFDVVYTNAVMEHVENPLSTVKEALRILRPGGVFYAATVNWESYTRDYLGAGWSYLEPMHHVQLFTPNNVRELAKRTGFEVERIWTTGVRLADRRGDRETRAPWPPAWCKGLLSLASRFTDRGDSIKFLLRRP